MTDINKLWDEVIEHWTKNVEDIDNATLGASGCAFCREFNKTEGCYRCPIFTYTGRHWCTGTPYEKSRRSYLSYIESSGNGIETRKKAGKKMKEMLYFLLKVRKEQSNGNV